MKTKPQILEAISKLTFKIENSYPELYQFLDESPETIPVQEHPSLSCETFANYLAGLKQVLRQYKKTHSLSKP
jgi:hypothetical protein